MVHKKYIKRGGKLFGPYYYENYRSGKKVKSVYLGKSLKAAKAKSISKNSLNSSNYPTSTIAPILLVIFIFIGTSYLLTNFENPTLTGQVVSQGTLATQVNGLILNLEIPSFQQGEVIEILLICKVLLGEETQECNKDFLRVSKIIVYPTGNSENALNFLDVEQWRQNDNYQESENKWKILVDTNKYQGALQVSASYGQQGNRISSGIVKELEEIEVMVK